MKSRQKLHQFIDRLPESEITEALVFLEKLESRTGDSFGKTLKDAPSDDEPDDDDFDGGLSEARAQKPLPHEEIKRRLSE